MSAGTEIVPRIDPEALKTAGVEMSVTKNDLIDMILLQVEEELEAQIELAKQDYRAFLGVVKIDSETVEVKEKALVLQWVKDKHPQVLKVVGKDYVLKSGGYDTRGVYCVQSPQADLREPTKAYFTWAIPKKDIPVIKKFHDDCKVHRERINKWESDLRKLRNEASRKLRVQIMRAVLSGTESGKQILNTLDAISPHARYKKNLPPVVKKVRKNKK